MSAVVKYACKKHPKFQGTREPKADCVACRLLHDLVMQVKEQPEVEFMDGSTGLNELVKEK
jgi:hypothetical protein